MLSKESGRVSTRSARSAAASSASASESKSGAMNELEAAAQVDQVVEGVIAYAFCSIEPSIPGTITVGLVTFGIAFSPVLSNPTAACCGDLHTDLIGRPSFGPESRRRETHADRAASAVFDTSRL